MFQGRDIQPSILAKASRDFSSTTPTESSDRKNNSLILCFGDWRLKVKQILSRVHCALIADSIKENTADERHSPITIDASRVATSFQIRSVAS